MKDETAILEKVRGICMSFADSAERLSWGHPTFTVDGKAFAIYEKYKSEWCLCFCVELEHQSIFLKDSRFFMTPYIGKRGWLSLRVHAAPLNWKEVRELLIESHRLVSLLPTKHKAKAKRRNA